MKEVWGTKVDASKKPMGVCDITIENYDNKGHVESFRRRPVVHNEFIRKYVNELYDQKIIEEADCTSQWVAEPVLAKSKESHGDYRFAIDYRARGLMKA